MKEQVCIMITNQMQQMTIDEKAKLKTGDATAQNKTFCTFA